MARREALNEVRPVLEGVDKVTEVVDQGLDAVEKGVDVGAEAVEKAAHVAIEEAHHAVAWFRNPKVAVGVVIVTVSASAGFLGWQLAKRHYSKKYDERLDLEIESARKFFGRLNKVDKDGAVITPEEVAAEKGRPTMMEEAAEALKEYKDGPTQYNKVVAQNVTVTEDENGLHAEGEIVQSNVFLNGKPVVPADFDLVEESKNRDPDRPYVISQEEFMENEDDFPQNTLTYYAGDDILADDRDEVVDNVEDLVGTDNLVRFGHGSNDPNVVYVRNEKNSVDFEIALSTGKYAEEVHGFLQHSDSPPRQLRKHKKHGGRE
jgi:hypothetical protein